MQLVLADDEDGPPHRSPTAVSSQFARGWG